MLLKWACDLADKDGVGAYVDGSNDGAPLYTKFGFEDESKGDSMVASMARRRNLIHDAVRGLDGQESSRWMV